MFAFRADDPRNADDLRDYLTHELPGEPVERCGLLAKLCGGLFQLAKLLTEAIRTQQLTTADALDLSHTWGDLDPQRRLYDYYKQSWERVCLTMNEEKLAELVTYLAAAQGWVSERQIAEALNWYERHSLGRAQLYWSPQQLRLLLVALRWFADRAETIGADRSTFYQLRHQSVRDYLTAADGPVSPLALERMHQSIGEYYVAAAQENQGWAHVEPYGRFYAARHLRLSRNKQAVTAGVRVLTNLDYLQATLGDRPPTQRTAAGEPS